MRRQKPLGCGVSTLTRREHRVRPQTSGIVVRFMPFQPSPGANTGCDNQFQLRGHSVDRFQPSPGANTGCDSPRSQAGGSRPCCFNPHPARTPGATVYLLRAGLAAVVSTLTRREHRVRPQNAGASASADSFNPHPARTPGATALNSRLALCKPIFQHDFLADDLRIRYFLAERPHICAFRSKMSDKSARISWESQQHLWFAQATPRYSSSIHASSYTKSMGGVAARPLDSWIGLRDAVPIKPVGTNALPPCDR